jgi:hypothetical protein
MRDALARGLEEAIETVRWTASLPMPELDCDYVFAAISGGGDYPLERGDTILLRGRDPVPVDQ